MEQCKACKRDRGSSKTAHWVTGTSICVKCYLNRQSKRPSYYERLSKGTLVKPEPEYDRPFPSKREVIKKCLK